MSMGGNATKYYLKTSLRSLGMEDVGGCLFIAKETGNLLKKLEIGLCIIISRERPR